MSIDVLIGILIPFVGTALGAACVFFLKDQIPALVQKGLLGFASGVMVAASVWSLLIPAIEMSEDMGRMAFVAVTLHNIPEGMAVGVAFAGYLSGEGTITLAGAAALAMGIAIQNFPEGAVISLPLRSEGQSRLKAFVCGTLSGIVEPIGAVITIAFAGILTPILPYILSFAAGAMLYVVVEELIPEASEGNHSNIGTLGFGVGFVVMMILDVALG